MISTASNPLTSSCPAPATRPVQLWVVPRIVGSAWPWVMVKRSSCKPCAAKPVPPAAIPSTTPAVSVKLPPTPANKYPPDTDIRITFTFSPTATVPGKSVRSARVTISPDIVPANRIVPSIAPLKDPPKATFNVSSMLVIFVRPVTVPKLAPSSVRVFQFNLLAVAVSAMLVRKYRFVVLAVNPAGKPTRSAVPTKTSSAAQLRSVVAVVDASLTNASSAFTPVASKPVAPFKSARATNPVITDASVGSWVKPPPTPANMAASEIANVVTLALSPALRPPPATP